MIFHALSRHINSLQVLFFIQKLLYSKLKLFNFNWQKLLQYLQILCGSIKVLGSHILLGKAGLNTLQPWRQILLILYQECTNAHKQVVHLFQVIDFIKRVEQGSDLRDDDLFGDFFLSFLNCDGNIKGFYLFWGFINILIFIRWFTWGRQGTRNMFLRALLHSWQKRLDFLRGFFIRIVFLWGLLRYKLIFGFLLWLILSWVRSLRIGSIRRSRWHLSSKRFFELRAGVFEQLLGTKAESGQNLVVFLFIIDHLLRIIWCPQLMQPDLLLNHVFLHLHLTIRMHLNIFVQELFILFKTLGHFVADAFGRLRFLFHKLRFYILVKFRQNNKPLNYALDCFITRFIHQSVS